MLAMTDQLILTADAYCDLTQSTRSSIAGRIFNDGKRLDAIADGADLNTRNYEKAMRWFDENWPIGKPWPQGVERPSMKAVADGIEREIATMMGGPA